MYTYHSSGLFHGTGVYASAQRGPRNLPFGNTSLDLGHTKIISRLQMWGWDQKGRKDLSYTQSLKFKPTATWGTGIMYPAELRASSQPLWALG